MEWSIAGGIAGADQHDYCYGASLAMLVAFSLGEVTALVDRCEFECQRQSPVTKLSVDADSIKLLSSLRKLFSMDVGTCGQPVFSVK
jgi:hypothetical protein